MRDELGALNEAADLTLEMVPSNTCVPVEDVPVRFPEVVASSGDVCVRHWPDQGRSGVGLPAAEPDVHLSYSPSSQHHATGCVAEVSDEWWIVTGSSGDLREPCPDGFDFRPI
ncbi:hypothetical protein [Rhabdothermincola salaria]|uniref:hypothetical protein n=1 Tax=Rhabdothermincola salaria TaxID=2903142 RepID=UPI001E314ED9|nr:hypothetical protein [Rhabdothermincola salaria]MCD9624957.1 hypothetical protein [Rhabdothermincola salaria]